MSVVVKVFVTMSLGFAVASMDLLVSTYNAIRYFSWKNRSCLNEVAFNRFCIGEDCSQKQQLECNYEKTPEMPYGRWVVSICSRHCDTTRAMCFCGEGTKYPNRPAPESCGFQIK